MAIRQQKKISSLAVVPGVRLDLNPLSQLNGSAHSLRNFIPERGRLIRKAFAPDYTVISSSTSEGPNNPSAAISVHNPSASISDAWLSPTNVFTSNDARASVTFGSVPLTRESDFLDITGYGFSVATQVNIIGFTVSIEAQDSSAGIMKFQILKNSSPVGETKLVGLGSFGASDTIVSVGGSTDLWSTTLVAEDINRSGFGVRVWVDPTATGTVSIDHVTMQVAIGPAAWEIKEFSYTRADAPEKQLIIFRQDGKVYRRQSSYEQEIFPAATGFSALAQKPFVGQLGNRLFFSDGVSSYVYDGRDVQTWGIARTTTAPTVSAVAAGSLTASTGLKAAITWVVQDEAGNRVHESNRTNKSGFQVLTSENLRIDKSALTAPARATHWSGYVSELDGSEILRRTNTTIISTDTFDVSALPAATDPKAPIRNNEPPVTTVGTVAKNRMFIRDDRNPDTFFFSALGEVVGLSNGAGDESFPGQNSSGNTISDLVNSDFIPDRDITNIIEHESITFIFSKTRGFGLIGQVNLLDNRAPRSLVKLQFFTEGCIGPDASAPTPFGLSWMNNGRKIYLWDGGARLIDIGEPIQPILDLTDSVDRKEVQMKWYSGNGRQWLVVTIESDFETADGSFQVATRHRCLMYDFSLPVNRPDQRQDPGTWFEWVDNEYVSVGIFDDEGQEVLLLGTETGEIKHSDVIAQPAHVEFTAVAGKMYANNSEQNNPASFFRTGLVRPEGDNWVTAEKISINTGSQDGIENLTTQPTVVSGVDPQDSRTAADITLTLESALANGERRAWLQPEASGNTNVGGALLKSTLFEIRYAAGVDTLETNESRNKAAVNALYKTSLTWTPQPETSQ